MEKRADMESKSKTIVVFGANGKVGSAFVRLAAQAGYPLRAFVRTPEKFDNPDAKHIELVRGDATNADDVRQAIDGADVVASFLGNPHPNPRNIFIMEAAADHIMTAAATQPEPPRCLMISSVGVGGSSWLIKLMLQMIGGKASFADYERAETRVRAETGVPVAVIRPYALNDKPATGRYAVIGGRTAHFAKPISRPDVAKFFLDCVEDPQWDGPQGVNLGGA
jgi:nucleoside-diphosphate-sugar epimerase